VLGRVIRTLLAFALLCLAALAAGAQEDALEARLASFAATLDGLEARLARAGLSEDTLETIRGQAAETAVAARALAASLAPQADNLRARLDALRPAPPPAKPGEAAPAPAPPPPGEPAELAREREAVERALGRTEADLRRARALATRADQIAAAAEARVRERFAEVVFSRTRSILDPDLWRDAWVALPPALAGLRTTLDGLGTRADEAPGAAVLALLVLFLSIAGVALPPVRGRLVAFSLRFAPKAEPSPLGRAVAALGTALVTTALPILGFLLALGIARSSGLIDASLEPLTGGLGGAIALVAATFALSRAILSPAREDWRIARLDHDTAARLAHSVPWPALVVALGLLLAGLAEAIAAPQALVILGSGILALLFALALLSATRHLRHRLADGGAGATGGAPAATGARPPTMAGLRLARLATPAASLAGLVVIATVLLGHTPLASFLALQVVWVGLVAAAYLLVANLIDRAAERHAAGESRAAARIGRFLAARPASVRQGGILLFGLLKLAAAGAALLALALPYGVRSASVFDRLRALLTGFEVGGLTISITSLLAALAVFAIVLALARALRSWLAERYLPATGLDPGLRTSITTAAGYLGAIVAALAAFGYLGIDLSRLALVAGALSVGIGFGLQSIVNNFVSGLILLAERPIKAGDWIVVGPHEGNVRKINVRSTEIETFDRSTVVIPNSDLISGTVKNWYLSGLSGRIDILVNVSYEADPEEARRILLACASAHPLVLDHPEPAVFLIDFGPTALVFRLFAHVGDISTGLRVKSDLRLAILSRFRAAGIEIAPAAPPPPPPAPAPAA